MLYFTGTVVGASVGMVTGIVSITGYVIIEEYVIVSVRVSGTVTGVELMMVVLYITVKVSGKFLCSE